MTHPLRQYRKDNKVTLEAMAAALGVRAPTVSRWETGDRKPGHDDLKKIEAVTGIPLADLINAAPEAAPCA